MSTARTPDTPHLKEVTYKSNAGKHAHRLCNHCTDCGEPLLGVYCNGCQPSWFLYWCHRLYNRYSLVLTKVKLFFTGKEPLL